MKTKYVRVPFEVELAKKIHSGDIEGRIITRGGEDVRIVCWNKADRLYPIVTLVLRCENEEEIIGVTNDGKYYDNGGETSDDLFLEIPEYMTFKDGDVIVCDKSVLLFSGDVNQYDLCGCYCSLFGDTESLDLNFDYKGVFPETRIATEYEKQKLIDSLKESKEPKAKEYLKRFFGIEVKQECEFKPFDKVLVRNDKLKWYADIFSNKDGNGKYVCIGWNWDQCIPYEGNEHLLGTTENYE